MPKYMEIEWFELGKKVTAELLEEKNPELCKVLWDGLPLKGVQEHCLVTGEMIYIWVPLVTTARTPYTEKYSETRDGRIFYSEMTGQKFCIVYGPCTEALEAAVVAQVIEEDLETLRKVGKAVAYNYFWKKGMITGEFRRKGEK